jgi:glycosyl transferase family 25
MDHVKHAFYINLDSRPDRKQYMEDHLKTVGISAERFKAVKLTNGALGCSMSHLKLLELAKSNNWESILIMEDDIKFLNPRIFTQQLNEFLHAHKEFDVLLIAGNNVPPFTKIDDTCVKVTRCQTTTGYLVKNHYFDTLIQNVREGIKNLMKTPEKHVLYAIDKYWFRLQERDNWYLIIPLTVTQREDYSDIEKRMTNYSSSMLDLDKEAFLRAQKTAFLKAQSSPSMKLF